MRIVNFGFELGGLGALRSWGEDREDAGGWGLIDHPDPQYFLPPTSGTAANGKPIFSWDQAAQQITRSGASWSATDGVGVTISYAFRSTAPSSMPDDTSGFSQFSAAQIAITEEALRLWSDVANINFTRVGTGTGASAYSNNATILFGNYSTGPEDVSAFAFFPSPGATAANRTEGDVWVDVSIATNANPVSGDIGAQVLAHEIGHAIGLSHPGNYNGGDPTYEANASYWQDARMFSIMSYFGSTNSGGNLAAFAAGPQLHDIAAAQRLYGAETIRTGNTTYGFHSNTGHANTSIASASATAVFSIWDSGGIDTLDLSGYNSASEIDLRPEGFSSAGPGNPDLTSPTAIGNISIARGVIIENAIGGGGGDTLIGNDAANILVGNEGGDTLEGREGDDALHGGGGDDSLTGGVGGDILNGSVGADEIDYSNSPARVRVNLSEGSARGGDGEGDQLLSVERVIGSQFNDNLVGSAAENVLSGGAGDDSLYGAAGDDELLGGAGADTLDGGDGRDSAAYLNAMAGIVLDLGLSIGQGGEAQGDVLHSIESATGSDFNDALIGSDLDNVLIGRAGDDTLIGNGGADTMDGGAGVDLADYSSSIARVRINLASGTGRDGAAEGDVLLNMESIIGSRLNDNLVGSLAGNLLIGGSGVDALFGGEGDDALKGGAGGDAIDGGEGSDTATYSTSAVRVRVRLDTGTAKDGEADGDTLVNVENVTGSDYNDGLTGSSQANTLSGRGGDDTLAGNGGDDILSGGGGADVFVFSAELGSSNVDVIVDFSADDDTIWLENAVFTGLGLGGLSPAAFHIGSAAHDASDRVVYHAALGHLYFDVDGNGAAAAILFATLTSELELSAQDLWVI